VDYGVGTRINGTGLGSDRPCKPIVPAFETPVWLRFVHEKVAVIDIILSRFTEPAVRLIFIHVRQRGLRAKHNIVIVKNFL